MARRTSNLRAMRNLTATFQESGDTLYWPVHLLISSRNCLVACGRDKGRAVRWGGRRRRRSSTQGASLVTLGVTQSSVHRQGLSMAWQTQQLLGAKQGALQQVLGKGVRAAGMEMETMPAQGGEKQVVGVLALEKRP